jgi:diaminohydroxyphosphoribosylaminopyrimidine deaminase/5-amino-6-(5-phosphoribosylamino)uracil reductase
LEDEIFMEKALILARRGLGKTSPNPMVGALVVKGRKILGKGYHRKYGGAHAEVIALRNAKGDVRGASIYVTLEPCCHHGWTPPCVDALVGAGISRVVIGTPDPNPRVNGKGIQSLLNNGIQVKVGVLEQRCRELNEAYFKYITNGIPFVTLKFAQSLDGRIATKTGHSQWISSPESLRLGHTLRSMHDGVLVGIGTILVDDPGLTIIVATERASRGKAQSLKNLGAEILWARENQRGKVDMEDLLGKLGRMGITSVLVEGGAKIITSFLRERLADKIVIVMAPKLIGEGIEAVGDLEIRDLNEALQISRMKMRRLGGDIVIEGYLGKGSG